MSRQAENLVFTPDIPNADGRVTPSGAQHIKCGVKSARIDTTEMSVVVAHHFVCLKIPALDKFVLAHSEHIRVAVTDSDAAHGADMPGKRELCVRVRVSVGVCVCVFVCLNVCACVRVSAGVYTLKVRRDPEKKSREDSRIMQGSYTLSGREGSEEMREKMRAERRYERR